MTTVEVTLPDDLDAELDRMVDEGQFLSREQAIEELLSTGLSAYDTTAGESEQRLEETVEQTFQDQGDPAMQEDEGDGGPTF
ncbi:MAG: ribbon-helix-helix domain-containing protein [Halanaeroarchaeum sp.]